MKRLALAAVLLIASIAAALAQSPVSVIGPITPGDCAAFSSNTVVKDGGFPCPGSGGTLNLPNGTTATTQPLNDNTTKVATDAFVQNQIGAIVPVAPGGVSGNVQFNNAGTFGGLTNTQLTADINTFTAGLSGAVPPSGGGTTNFLRADGTFANPGAGLPTIANGHLIANAKPATHLFADEKHWGFVALPLADHDPAAHRHRVHNFAHGFDRDLIGILPISLPHGAGRGNCCSFRHAQKIQ